MPEQSWLCEKCGTHGSIQFDTGTDLMTVVASLGDDHRRLAPHCDQPTARLLCPPVSGVTKRSAPASR
jgi:hypothetical protein